MKNPFQHNLIILERGKDHFSGKKKPWEERVDYPPTLAAIYLIEIIGFALLLWFLPDWRTVLLFIAALSMWGLSEATKSKFYKIGYYDGSQDSGTENSKVIG